MDENRDTNGTSFEALFYYFICLHFPDAQAERENKCSFEAFSKGVTLSIVVPTKFVVGSWRSTSFLPISVNETNFHKFFYFS